MRKQLYWLSDENGGGLNPFCPGDGVERTGSMTDV